MAKTKPHMYWQQDDPLNRYMRILFGVFVVVGIAGGLWVAHRSGGWMWLIAPAIGSLWAFLLVLGSFLILFLSVTTTGGTTGKQTYKVISIWTLGMLAHIGLFGYFAYWALNSV